MRNLQTIISNIGIQNICQGQISMATSLIVRNEVVRSLRATLSTLRWYASRLSDDMRGGRWHGLAAMAFMAKQPVPCFATAKQHGRHVRVIVRRSVG